MRRRNFIKSCLNLSIWGASSVWFSKKGSGKEYSPDFEPAYLKLHRSGELKKRGMALWKMMRNCQLCPRHCGVDRTKGIEGFCHSTSQLKVSAYNPHFGEEKPLVGRGGSGTIFLTNCNLRCVFCINWQINHKGLGTVISINNLAEMMLKLQNRGCHNINMVTPTHYSPHIVLAIDKAAKAGLKLPLVYNTSGWEKLDVLKKLNGIVDIYLPDFKYSESEMAQKYSSGAESYPQVTQNALLEMFRQVGVASPAKNGLMYRGLMIRHLVMPNEVSGTREVIKWIANNLPKDTYLNLMSQYRPAYKASEFPKISRKINRKEYKNAITWARDAGLTNLYLQGYHWTN